MRPGSSQGKGPRTQFQSQQGRVATAALYKTLNRISQPTVAQRVPEAKRKALLTGFILAGFSILASFFPICGLPIAIAGLMMGIAGRRVVGLRSLANWTVALASIGLILAVVNIIVSVSFYFSGFF